jgi:hypothetical protein
LAEMLEVAELRHLLHADGNRAFYAALPSRSDGSSRYTANYRAGFRATRDAPGSAAYTL